MTCGQALPGPCARCGTLLPPAARFCFHCGQPQGETPPTAPPVSADPAPQALLRRFMPPELARKLTTAPGEGERRVVTMLFCDVKGSTAAAEKLDPEEWVEIINGAFENMIRPVYQYEGVVARLMGDGILAFFGAPVAHEDDPQRAVLAGLAILDLIRPYRVEIGRRWGVDIDVRVGINTGLVVVGAVGSDLRLEYTAIGDAINLAARMEQTAEPGTVQVAEDTYRLIAPLFDFEELGPLAVKGKEQPVRAYRVLGRKAQPGRLRGIAGLESPLVGRDREFDILRDSLTSLSGEMGGVLFILGEAGLGKSRLIGEGHRLIERLAPAHGWFETASLSYETAQPYGLFQRLLRRLFGVTIAEDPARLRSSLAAEMGSLYDGADAGEAGRDALERMLFGDSSVAEGRLEGEMFQSRLREAMADLWRRRARKTPTVLVFDDLHWADAASVELLSRLFDLAEESPVLFICAMRPDPGVTAWSAHENAAAAFGERFRAIRLTPLSMAESGDLVRGLFRQIDWPPQLERRVLEKAGGNPFFVEEIVRALMERGVIAQETNGRWAIAESAADVDLPETLQGLLLARIDRLEDDARRTLQLASVIGRSFYFQVLAALADAAARLERQVSDLLAADLIREAARAPELEYMFTHALTQQAAYSSILLKRRREFHRRVGQAMEQLFPHRQEELSPILAQHFDQALEREKAIRYYAMAGDVAFRLYAKAEAAAHYRRALDLALAAGRSDPASIERLFTCLGRTLELMARYGEALTLYEEMEAWATANGKPEALLAALLGRATIRSTANAFNDPREAAALLERAKALSAETGDRATEARILWNLMLLTSLNKGIIAEQRSYVDEALRAARAAGSREQEAYILFDSWYHYGGAGAWRTGERHLLEVLGLWRELGNMPLLAETYARLKYTAWFLGEYDRALGYSAEGYRLAGLSHNLEAQAIALSGEGMIHVDRGDLGRGLAVMEEAVRLGREVDVVTAVGGTQADLGWTYGWLGLAREKGIPLAESAAAWLEERMGHVAGFALAPLARLHLLAGDMEPARRTIAKLGTFRDQHRQIGFVASIWIQTGLVESELWLRAGRPDEALATAGAVRSLMEAGGVRYLLPDVILLTVVALRRLGKHDESSRALTEAVSVAQAIGSRRILWEVLALAAQFARRQNDETTADKYLREAEHAIAEMVATLPPDLQGPFRQRTTARLTEWLGDGEPYLPREKI